MSILKYAYIVPSFHFHLCATEPASAAAIGSLSETVLTAGRKVTIFINYLRISVDASLFYMGKEGKSNDRSQIQHLPVEIVEDQSQAGEAFLL